MQSLSLSLVIRSSPCLSYFSWCSNRIPRTYSNLRKDELHSLHSPRAQSIVVGLGGGVKAAGTWNVWSYDTHSQEAERMWFSFTLGSLGPKPRDGINLIKRLPHSHGQKLTQPRKPFTLVVPEACHLLGDTRPYQVGNIDHHTLNLGFVFFASAPTLWNGCSYPLKWFSGSHPLGCHPLWQ